MRSFRVVYALVLSLGVVSAGAGSASGALASAGGGSGYSGTLSSNQTIRQQQLICDPTGAPLEGSTSINYNPAVVKLTSAALGPGYYGSGLIEVNLGVEGIFLTDLASYLASPIYPQTGYVQIFYTQYSSGVMSPLPSPGGLPGQLPVANGFTFNGHAGPNGTDTHEIGFTYLPSVSSSVVAHYDVYAIGPENSHGASSDYIVDANQQFIRFDQIQSASIASNLQSVPLPPAAWSGIGMLGLMGAAVLWRRKWLLAA